MTSPACQVHVPLYRAPARRQGTGGGRMKPAPFTYHRAETLAEAAEKVVKLAAEAT